MFQSVDPVSSLSGWWVLRRRRRTTLAADRAPRGPTEAGRPVSRLPAGTSWARRRLKRSPRVQANASRAIRRAASRQPKRTCARPTSPKRTRRVCTARPRRARPNHTSPASSPSAGQIEDARVRQPMDVVGVDPGHGGFRVERAHDVREAVHGPPGAGEAFDRPSGPGGDGGAQAAVPGRLTAHQHCLGHVVGVGLGADHGLRRGGSRVGWARVPWGRDQWGRPAVLAGASRPVADGAISGATEGPTTAPIRSSGPWPGPGGGSDSSRA